MRKLSQLLIIALSLIFTTNAMAQSDRFDLQYRVEAGASITKVTNFLSGDALIRERLAVSVAHPFRQLPLEMSLGLAYANRGERFNDKSLSRPYLDLNLQAGLPLHFYNEHRLILATGPVLAFNFADMSQQEEYLRNYKVFDCLWDVNASYTYKSIFIKSGLQISTTSVRPIETAGTTRHIGGYITLGYEF